MRGGGEASGLRRRCLYEPRGLLFGAFVPVRERKAPSQWPQPFLLQDPQLGKHSTDCMSAVTVPLSWDITIHGGPIRCNHGVLIEGPPLPTHFRRSLAAGSDAFLATWPERQPRQHCQSCFLDTPSERRAAPAGEPRGLSVRCRSM